MDTLKNSIWTEKYRPESFENLISDQKSTILNYLKDPLAVPSFLFFSNRPGTGKTSTAKAIIKHLGCDSITINASEERGIDTIRDRINSFARSMSGSKSKRCVFMDEFDGMTKTAQESLRNVMEEYSDNCFFILTCNDLNKVIEPIRSRCVSVNFERPNKASIVARLEEIATTEQVTADYEQLEKLVDEQYPDIRSMVTILQTCKINNKPLDFQLTEQSYYYMLDLIKQGKQKTIYEVVYSGEFDMVGFNRWFFRYVFENIDDFNVCRNVTLRLAEIEKSWNQNANQEIIFLSNILQVVELMKC